MKIPSDEVRKQHMEKCDSCENRKVAAKCFDMHFDWLDCWYTCPNDYEHWLDCWYNCPNDYEHWLAEEKDSGTEKQI